MNCTVHSHEVGHVTEERAIGLVLPLLHHPRVFQHLHTHTHTVTPLYYEFPSTFWSKVIEVWIIHKLKKYDNLLV